MRSGSSGSPVAVKTIRKYESEKEKEAFFKEMNVMSQLMHPNIVRLFGLVQQGSNAYKQCLYNIKVDSY